MSEETLTGRRRFRVVDLNAYSRIALDRRDVIVLQVEYSIFSKVLGKHCCHWRDACADDITSAETVIGLPNNRG